MNTLKQKLLGMNFKKWIKRWCIAAVIVLLATAVAGGILWRSDATGEADQQPDASVQSNAATAGEDAQDEQTGEHDGDHQDEQQDEHEDAELFDRLETMPLIVRIALGVLFAASVLLGVALWLLVAAWLYQAAENGGMNGALWSILGLVGFIVTAIVFVIVRSFRPVCPSCGKRQQNAAFCRFCGASMTAKCKECGLAIPKDSAFCPHCGKAQKDE